MGEVISRLKDILPLAGIGAVAAGYLLLLVWYRRTKRAALSPQRPPERDLANMMILFQTMRDVIQEQKELARRFNESLDRKVALVREAVDEALQERDRLRAAHAQMSTLIADMKRDLARLQRHVGHMKDTSLPLEPGDNGAAAEPAAAESATLPAAETRNGKRAVEPLIACAEPDEPPAQDDPAGRWTGLDLVEQPALQDTEAQTPAAPAEKPEETQAARDAFRTLLDLAERGTFEESASFYEPPVRVNGAKNTNGGTLISAPLHRRVYEYHDAGMTVPQIAHELGVGKGEVRLMLSLRKDRER